MRVLFSRIGRFVAQAFRRFEVDRTPLVPHTPCTTHPGEDRLLAALRVT
jgi:hypothetical protein